METQKPHRVDVLFFSVLRERTGIDSTAVPLDPGETLSAARFLERLTAAHPALRPLIPHVRVAVNREYVSGEHIVRAGDEVALITPVSGG